MRRAGRLDSIGAMPFFREQALTQGLSAADVSSLWSLQARHNNVC